MLTESELKIVMETLSKRRSLILKTMNSPEISYNDLDFLKESAALLETAIGKIQRSSHPAVSATTKSSDPEVFESLPTDTPVTTDYRILIADDDSYSAEILKDILEDIKMSNVDVATDGNLALDHLLKASQPYDIVLCDWNMPGKSGLEVHNAMRLDDRYQDSIFMLVSAVSEGEEIRKAIQQGVNDYIVKPLDAGILRKKINTACKKYEERRAH